VDLKGFTHYQRREFCKDIRCPVQIELEGRAQGSPEYEATRKVCQTACRYTTYQFHHWLIEKGYLVVRPAAGK